MSNNAKDIRNVAIIAHINHGKSTLADRLLEKTGTIPPLKMRAQVLDNMELERERGVTIKLKAVRMEAQIDDHHFIINLIDTPGHVDFSYEVSRSLAACEGALLIVDAVSGIQAQTVAHTQKALDLGLTIIPIVNKIDIEGAEPEAVAQSLVDSFGFFRQDILFASAKIGEGVEEILRAVYNRVPPPPNSTELPLRALVFDSSYHEHKGVIAYVRLVDGSVKKSDRIFLINAEAENEVGEVGFFKPEMLTAAELSSGDVGYISTGLKDISLVRVGDTVTLAGQTVTPLSGYRKPKSVVFESFYPVDNKKFSELEEALKKLRLTDPSVNFERESSSLGQGFRCGFLGLFHAEIVKERLERDNDLEIFATTPTVEYQLISNGESAVIKTAADLKQASQDVLEPWVNLQVFTPPDYLGGVMQVCEENRGLYTATDYLSERQVKLSYEMPLAELIGNFFDRVKSVSSGFASIDYDFIDSRPVKVSRLDILVAGELAEPLSQIVLSERAEAVGRRIVQKLKEVLPKEQFPVALQAVIGGKILARETIPAFRKDVTAKLYGGDRTRKDKLLKKQAAGKKRLKKFGRVNLPQEAFFAARS